MKKFLVGFALVVFMVGAFGQTPNTYQTVTASGTNQAEYIFPASGVLQSRLVGLIVSSDKTGAVVSVRSGLGAYLVSATNASTGTNITVIRTNGLASNDVIVVQTKAGATASATITSISRTNLGLSAASGIDTIPGDAVCKLGPTTDLLVGPATNVVYQGEAIKVGERGRPLRILVDGTGWAVIDAASVKWE